MRTWLTPLQFTYNQEAYWDLLRDTALAKRAEYLAHWEHLGGGVGQSEWEFKQPLPVLPTTAATATVVSTPVRSQSLSSEATIHDNHGIDMHNVEKAITGMVITEDPVSPRTEVTA